MSHPNIYASEVILGKDTYISPSATIRGTGGIARRISIGDHTFIGDNVQIIADNFSVGDYCKIHHHSVIHGSKPIEIGHNAWIGQNCIIDGLGGVTIGNNCGIGAYSQLWSHIRYGDPLIGCNYNSYNELTVGNDVWFVGHCIVSPIVASDRSMALVGSVVTKNMSKDCVYGGAPAKELTGKVRSQFSDITLEEKRSLMSKYDLPANIVLIEKDEDIVNDGKSYFNIISRRYTKRGTSEEIRFMKNLQVDLVKFVPY